MLQSTINLIRQKTATKEDFMAMSKEDRGDLYLDLMDTAEHLTDDDDVAYCEKLLVVLEDIERNPVAVVSKEEPEAMRIVSITASPYATQYGELSVPKDLTGENCGSTFETTGVRSRLESRNWIMLVRISRSIMNWKKIRNCRLLAL